MAAEIPTILKKILARKQQEVNEQSAVKPLSSIVNQIESASIPRGFTKAIANRIDSGQAAVIAEIKRASPSKGLLCENFNPSAIARSYEAGGACCLSVLTDVDFFQGADAYLLDARSACDLPVIRKDFIIDEYQVYAARAMGADCVLLIVSALAQSDLLQLHGLAVSLGMDVLIEVHDKEELDRALVLGNSLIGINNRNLHSFEVSLDNTFQLLDDIPKEIMVVTESGIATRADVSSMREKQVHGFLVGEAFMRSADPGQKLKELFF
jgi:indole-3-glycerol phosphate synthase